jgi:hypothetical protein
MRLHDYFAKIQWYKLSEQEKNALYERILRQTQYQKPIFSRTKFYTKVAGYMTFLGILGLSIYIPFLGQKQNSDNGIQTASVAKAWYIAKVVNVQWEYFIESNGKRIEWSNINDWDRVVLAKWSSLVVQVGDKVEGKISGPATFVVNRSEKWYAITMKDGDYMEFATVGNADQSPELSLISETHKFTARAQAGKWFHFVLTEENRKPLLVNKSNQDIQVVNDNTPNKTVFLAENKSLSVGTYIFATTVAPTEVAKVIARATPNSTIEKINEDYDSSFFRGMLLASSKAESVNNTASSSAATMMKSSSTMSDVAQSDESVVKGGGTEATISAKPVSYNHSEVRSNLIPQFVWVDIKYVTYYYLNGQDHEYHIAYENLLKRIYNLYDALKLEIPSEWVMSSQKDAYSLQKIRVLAEYIQNNLPAQVLDHQKNTLDTLVTFVQRLSQHTFGEYKWQDLSLEQMFEKIN